MTPYYDQDGMTLFNADARAGLRGLPDGAFNTCVTSPPYFGLRDYGVDGQMGLEPTPDEYVAGMVAVFREVRRCLREDGTLWLNIGDSYANTPCGSFNGGSALLAGRDLKGHGASGTVNKLAASGLKQKDLMGIPWMLAFALRADGWYLRSDIIWAKAVSFCPTYNGTTMPESVQDRPTKAHEYLFLLSKSADYFYDFDAVSEKAASAGKPLGFTTVQADAIGKKPSGNQKPENYLKPRGDDRNLRSVWTVNPKPYPGAHFATFPEDLVKPCILAGSPAGGAVLEPFAGSGTTLKVARDLGRRATGVELNPAYCGLVVDRLRQGVLFAATG